LSIRVALHYLGGTEVAAQKCVGSLPEKTLPKSSGNTFGTLEWGRASNPRDKFVIKVNTTITLLTPICSVKPHTQSQLVVFSSLAGLVDHLLISYIQQTINNNNQIFFLLKTM